VALELAEAVVSITGDMNPLARSMGQAERAVRTGVQKMQVSLAKVGQSMRRLGRSMTMFVTAPIVAGFALMVKAASDFQEQSDKFNAVFKELRGEARTWADQFAKDAGRSRLAVTTWMASLQDTFVPLGIARKRSLEMSKVLVQLAVDVAAFNNRADPEVIRAFTTAITGERESLKTLGIVIDEADIKSEILAQGWAKNTSEITKMMKAEATLNLMLARSKDAQGNNAATANTLAGQFRRLKTDVTNLSVELGTTLLPVAQSLVKTLRSLAGWASKLTDSQKAWALGILAVAAALGPLLIVLGSVAQVISTAIVVVPLLTAAFVVLLPVLAGVATALGLLLAGFVAFQVGWKFGELIAGWLGIDKAIMGAARALDIYGQKSAEAESAKLDVKLQSVRERNDAKRAKTMKQLGVDRKEFDRLNVAGLIVDGKRVGVAFEKVAAKKKELELEKSRSLLSSSAIYDKAVTAVPFMGKGGGMGAGKDSKTLEEIDRTLKEINARQGKGIVPVLP